MPTISESLGAVLHGCRVCHGDLLPNREAGERRWTLKCLLCGREYPPEEFGRNTAPATALCPQCGETVPRDRIFTCLHPETKLIVRACGRCEAEFARQRETGSRRALKA